MQHSIVRIRFKNFECIFFIVIINTNLIKQKLISEFFNISIILEYGKEVKLT